MSRRSLLHRLHHRSRPLSMAWACSLMLHTGHLGAAFPSDKIDWPVIPVPGWVQQLYIGERLELDGLPVHLALIESGESPSKMAEWFLQHLPGMHTSDDPSGWVLWQQQADFLTTVVLKPLPPRQQRASEGTRGMVITTPLLHPDVRPERLSLAYRTWQKRLPAGGRLLQHLSSHEGHYRHEWVLATLPLPVDQARTHVIALLGPLGYSTPYFSYGPPTGSRQMLWFEHNGASARVVLFDQPPVGSVAMLQLRQGLSQGDTP